MCGIAGFVEVGLSREDALVQLQRMLARIAHRGPDDEGAWQEGPVAMGHRRLSVLDPSPLGHQPMLSADQRYVLAFNGEIYNHLELREQLESRGECFSGHSDTEVLLALIERIGLVAALQQSVGMFAIALWDRERHTLQFARDRFGEKPLYYGWHRGTFIWGSELKALLSHPKFQRIPDPAAISMLLKYGYVPGPLSIFQTTYKLLPAHVLQLKLPNSAEKPVTPQTCSQQLRPFWSAQEIAREGFQQPFKGSYGEAVECLDLLVTQAVRLQMQADVPLGAFLSGGVDSSLVVALMQQHSSLPVRTFSIGFEDPKLDEAPAARAVAKQLGTTHTEQYISAADAMAIVPQLPDMFCEPMADFSQIPTHLVSRLARQSVTVSLSGDGGDEVFGGYTKYITGWNIAQIPGRRGLGKIANTLPLSTLARIGRDTFPRWARALRESRIANARRLLNAESYGAIASILAEITAEPNALMKRLEHAPLNLGQYSMPDHRAAGYLRAAMALDIATYLPDDILIKVDRSSMTVSLESRAPLLDHRLFEFSTRLPTDFLCNGVTAKRILRDALYRRIPRSLVDRPKSGFTPPLGYWLRGSLQSWALDLLSSSTGPIAECLAMPALRSLFDRHVNSETEDFGLQLWPALTLLSWGQRYL